MPKLTLKHHTEALSVAIVAMAVIWRASCM